MFGLWLVLSGHYSPFFLIIGAACSALVVFISLRMDVLDHEYRPLHLGWRLLRYLPWLIFKIIQSNIAVTRCILHPGMPIQPTLVKLQASQKSELGQVTYANSITLTPGTVTIELKNGEIEAHALTREAAMELEAGEMDRRVTRIMDRH
jgi:multicomponent Na+:H+ antiporter subunit E